jgi:hypothetical protein
MVWFSRDRLEDFPMTLQIGMKSPHGIVLAGDTWCYRMPLPQFQGSGALWDGYFRSKIKISASRRVAISSAVDMDTADSVADRILGEIEQIPPEMRESGIQRIVGAVCPQREFECIAAFLDPQYALYSLQYRNFGGEPHLTVIPMLRYCTAGDSMNPAVFWPMRYYKRDLGISALKRLAVHTLVMASEQSSGNIRGLEIVVSGGDGFQKIPEEECERTENEAKRQGQEIGILVLGEP